MAADRDKFEVVTDKLYRIEEAKFSLKRYLVTQNILVAYDKVFYFENCGEINVLKRKERTAKEGDSYYVVMYKNAPIMIYSESEYEYKEIEK